MKYVRPNLDVYFMSLAVAASSRATCSLAKVGAVIVDQDNHVVATGYNGSLPGHVECTHNITPSHGGCQIIREGKDSRCNTIHAEVNALAQARKAGQPLDGCRIYVTYMPCLDCAYHLVQANIKEVIYLKSNTWKDTLLSTLHNEISFRPVSCQQVRQAIQRACEDCT